MFSDNEDLESNSAKIVGGHTRKIKLMLLRRNQNKIKRYTTLINKLQCKLLQFGQIKS